MPKTDFADCDVDDRWKALKHAFAPEPDAEPDAESEEAKEKNGNDDSDQGNDKSNQ